MFFVIVSIDSIELIRDSGSHVITVGNLLAITLTKLPFILQETFVFVVFFAAVHTFFFLAKNNEYTALRSGGVSIWQFLAPFTIVGVAISILLITVINPFSTVLLNYSEQLKMTIRGKDMVNSVSLLGGEVWLFDKDRTSNESYIINAANLKAEKGDTELSNPNFIFLDKDYKFIRIINTPKAVLKDDNWVLEGYTEYVPKETPKLHEGEQYTIKNNLDLVNLQTNFKSARYISIWDLPYFISVLKATGYPTHKYYSYLYKLLVKPFLVPSIIFFAAAFALKSSRHHKVGVLIASGFLAFIFLYCLTELSLSISFNSKAMQMLNVIFIALALNIGGGMSVYYFESK
jgi:lipopolysaccharide export system permease protein